MGTKKSNFPASQTIDDAATLDFVINGQNFKIAKSDFLAALGVTGTIVQEGDIAGVPILDPQGSVNAIRNVEASVGVSAAVSAENGLELKTSLLPAASGVQTLFNETTAPQFRSITAGAGINVAQAGETIQIALASAPASSKTVIITQMSDFPAAVGGVITLEPNTDYFISADLSTSDRFVMQASTVLRGPDILIGKITYTGTLDFITVVDATAKITALQLTFMSANMGINASATAGNEGQFSMILDRVVMAGSVMGDIVSYEFLQILQSSFFVATDGFTLTGTGWASLIGSGFITQVMAGQMFNIGTTVFTGIDIANPTADLASGTFFLTGTTGSGNIAAGGDGTITSGDFTGLGTPLSGIASGDALWSFLLNDKIPDSITDALLSLSGNATETVITTINTPVKVAGTWVVERESKMTADTTGRATYDGTRDVVLPITISATVLAVGGGTDVATLYAAPNGVIAAASGATVSITSSAAARATIIWQDEFSNAEFIEFWVENNSDTSNILITDAVLRTN